MALKGRGFLTVEYTEYTEGRETVSGNGKECPQRTSQSHTLRTTGSGTRPAKGQSVHPRKESPHAASVLLVKAGGTLNAPDAGT